MATKNITLSERDGNRAKAPQLSADQIGAGVKVGINWPLNCRNAQEIDPSGWYNGEFYGYCVPCDEFHREEDFQKDLYFPPYGIKRRCKEAVKRGETVSGRTINRTKTSSNGTVALSNGHSKTPQPPADVAAEKAYHLEKLNEIWNKADDTKDMTFEKYFALGVVDKMKFIYITRWIGICDEFRKEMEYIIGENKEPYYVGQTNGRDFQYNGSGSYIKQLETLAKNYSHIDVERRIIQLTSLQETDDAERQKITETGANKYGLNNVEGSSKARLVSLSLKFDPTDDRHYNCYMDLIKREEETDIPKEELGLAWLINGHDAQLAVEDGMKRSADSGELGKHLKLSL